MQTKKLCNALTFLHNSLKKKGNNKIHSERKKSNNSHRREMWRVVEKVKIWYCDINRDIEALAKDEEEEERKVEIKSMA